MALNPKALWGLLVIFLILPCHCGGGGGGGGGSSGGGGSIRLAWDASPDSGVVSYRIYCGTQSGRYERYADLQPSAGGTGVSYTLCGLTPGQTYFIAVTARDSLGHESDFSNEVSGAAR